MEDNQQIPGHPDELNEMLLVLDKKQNKMWAVTQLTKNGEVKAAEINYKNQPDFLRIERHGDFSPTSSATSRGNSKNQPDLIFFAYPSSSD